LHGALCAEATVAVEPLPTMEYAPPHTTKFCSSVQAASTRRLFLSPNTLRFSWFFFPLFLGPLCLGCRTARLFRGRGWRRRSGAAHGDAILDLLRADRAIG
jgi:hypothetical protein